MAGASAGAVTAAVLLTSPGRLEDGARFLFSVAEEARTQALGPVTPGFNLMGRLRFSWQAASFQCTRDSSPWSTWAGGRADVSPRDAVWPGVCVRVANQDVTVSMPNLMRVRQALFPPDRRMLEAMYSRGMTDTVHFLRRERWAQ
ncbi:patatin-like phospholipase domain-containing protein 4 isoform X1 [Mus pahari]|uniref:patatin-like phospholipase domain-containing protein 4 isoform X1 n=1 Tax=Mus pahari TaxID=10093 RepID=UPI00111474AA|nr:patatin-like phospholipase domain-containing protein 4 isoform X1 [Mus pahari]